jgi:hypothetical protein
VAAGVLAVALISGGVRTLPLVLAPGVPPSLSLPFARAALLMALEVSLFVAPSIGAALAAAALVDRGEARALLALGTSPGRLVAGAWPAWLSLGLVAFGASLAWGREAAAPGRLIASLLAEGRAACVEEAHRQGNRPVAVDVPLSGISWVCLPGEAPRAVGAAPLGRGAVLAAQAIEPSPDLRAVVLRDVALVVPGDADRGALEVRVNEASIQGLVPLGRASNLRALVRASLVGSLGGVMGIVAALLVIAGAIGGRAQALCVGLAGPLAALLVLSALEREANATVAYAAVPAAGLFAALAVAFAARRWARRGAAGAA